MGFYKRALELKEETIAHRRYLHRNAEVGLDLPLAREYVVRELGKCGIEAYPCGYGIVATIGKGGKTLLLRADMDALPMKELSGESFASVNDGAAHACGHDFHTAMLLAAAKMLKEKEGELCGTVKLMFQPAEETLEGAKNMIDNGVLQNPCVDAALAYHVAAGVLPNALVMYNSNGTMMWSACMFKIKVIGKGAHGAYPQSAIDPVKIGSNICVRIYEIIENKRYGIESCTITVGHFESGSTANVIPDTAVIEGSIRANSEDLKNTLVSEVEHIAKSTAVEFGGDVEFETKSEVPPLICDVKLTETFVGYMKELGIPDLSWQEGISATASEDFAYITDKVPSTFMFLSAGFADERGEAPPHNPKVRFNENVCPLGSASLAHCAVRWLMDNDKNKTARHKCDGPV